MKHTTTRIVSYVFEEDALISDVDVHMSWKMDKYIEGANEQAFGGTLCWSDAADEFEELFIEYFLTIHGKMVDLMSRAGDDDVVVKALQHYDALFNTSVLPSAS